MSNAMMYNWLDKLDAAVAAQTFVKTTLAKPTPEAGDLKSVDVRPILVKRELKLSFTYHYKTKDIVKNYGPDESRKILTALLRESMTSARLFTLEADVLLTRKGKNYDLMAFAPTQSKPAELSHDRAKHRLIEGEGKPYLFKLGITDAQGAVLKNAQDKFKQINKYVEILDGLVKPLPADLPLKVADMGSGKGYLTFALYDHLATTLGRKAEVVGVEYRPDMVKLCNTLAAECGFTGLTFVQGTIADYDCSGTNVVIALHACDTATDDAIAKGVKAKAELIVVAPCCHKQVRREMAQGKGIAQADSLAFMMKFGTYTERMAEMVTDALRAQLLEMAGYGSNLFEFIADAHTPKNVMIVAVRKPAPLAAAEKGRLQEAFVAAKAMFGVGTHQLERLLATDKVA